MLVADAAKEPPRVGGEQDKGLAEKLSKLEPRETLGQGELWSPGRGRVICWGGETVEVRGVQVSAPPALADFLLQNQLR